MSFNKPQKSVVRFFLNVSSKAPKKETMAAYTHNGVIFKSAKNESAWVQFRALSDKQGWTPLEFVHEGKTYNIDPEKFWLKMFSANEVSELPDIKLKAGLTSIEDADEIYQTGGCLVIEADISNLSLSEGEYKNVPILYFHLKVEKYYLTASKGKTVDVQHILQSLGSAVTSTNFGADALSRYRRVPQTQPAQQMAEAVQEEKDDFDYDSLVSM